MRVLILCLSMFFVLKAKAVPDPLPSSDILDRIEFRYESNDGSFTLSCKHWIGNFSGGDFSVACGKGQGTGEIKNYSVHLRIRTVPKGTLTIFELMYWITDRNVKTPVPAFASHSQLFTVSKVAEIHELQMSEGVENDYAQLVMRYKP
jgi:hypothetical protein